MKKIVYPMSAAMMIIAAQALASAGNGPDRLIELGAFTVDPDHAARTETLMTQPAVRRVIARTLPEIAASYSIKGQTLVKRVLVAANATGDDADFTEGGGLTDPNVSCHCHCHSACHGSRGWR